MSPHAQVLAARKKRDVPVAATLNRRLSVIRASSVCILEMDALAV